MKGLAGFPRLSVVRSLAEALEELEMLKAADTSTNPMAGSMIN